MASLAHVLNFWSKSSVAQLAVGPFGLRLLLLSLSWCSASSRKPSAPRFPIGRRFFDPSGSGKTWKVGSGGSCPFLSVSGFWTSLVCVGS